MVMDVVSREGGAIPDRNMLKWPRNGGKSTSLKPSEQDGEQHHDEFT